MEGAVANILFFDKLHKTWVSPVSDYSFVEGLGLRVGLKSLDIRKSPIVKEDLNQYSAAFFINSLRGANAITEIEEFNFENSLTLEKELNDIFENHSKRNRERNMAHGKIIKVKCPKCEDSFNYYDSSFRPFCSGTL